MQLCCGWRTQLRSTWFKGEEKKAVSCLIRLSKHQLRPAQITAQPGWTKVNRPNNKQSYSRFLRKHHTLKLFTLTVAVWCLHYKYKLFMFICGDDNVQILIYYSLTERYKVCKVDCWRNTADLKYILLYETKKIANTRLIAISVRQSKQTISCKSDNC